MKYFYCNSYQAFNYALFLNQSSPIKIITSTENILEACKYLRIECLFFKGFDSASFLLRPKAVNERVELLSQAVGASELHFSHTQFDIFCFYLITFVNGRGGRTVFHNFEIVYSKASTVKNIWYLRSQVYKMLLRWYFSIDLEVREINRKAFVQSLSLRYIEKFSTEVVNCKANYYDSLMSLFKTFKISHEEIEGLFVAQTFANDRYFDLSKADLINSILLKYGTAIKMHPKLGEVEALSKLYRLPDFLPVELFFGNVTKYVISFYSTSLVTASMFDHLTVISLLDIVKHDNSFSAEVKEYLVKESRNRIEFPKSIEELDLILASI